MNEKCCVFARNLIRTLVFSSWCKRHQAPKAKPKQTKETKIWTRKQNNKWIQFSHHVYGMHVIHIKFKTRSKRTEKFQMLILCTHIHANTNTHNKTSNRNNTLFSSTIRMVCTKKKSAQREKQCVCVHVWVFVIFDIYMCSKFVLWRLWRLLLFFSPTSHRSTYFVYENFCCYWWCWAESRKKVCLWFDV